ncbi:MAG: hypothetical protein IKV69_02500 [Clostridia bacterium]|nr:hypothetical protein [Clostridia bacterium]
MFFKNLLKTKKYKKTNFLFDDYKNFLVDDNKETKLCYNFFVEDDALTSGLGFQNITLPIAEGSQTERTLDQVSKVKCDLWHFPCYDKATNTRQDKVFCSTECGNLLYFDIFALSRTPVILETNFDVLPSGVTYTKDDVDKMLFSASGKLTSFQVGEFASVEAILPQFVDLVWAYDRLFGVVEGKRDEILFSNILDPTMWTLDEEKIVLNDNQGSANKLVYFNDDLFVFRDYGITRISEFGVAKDIELFNVYSSKSKIYGKTVVHCGNKILFLARNGLYSFNGSKVQKILPMLTKYLGRFNNKNACGVFDGQNYLLACKLNFFDDKLIGCEDYEEGFTNNAVIVYNVFDESVNVVRGVDIRSMLKVNSQGVEKVFVTFFGEHKTKIAMLDCSGKIFDKSLPKCWQSKKFDFGALDKTKNVREIFVRAYSDCIVSVQTDIEVESYVVVGKNDVQRIKTFVRGKEIAVEVLAEDTSKILPLKLVVEEEK